MSKSEQEYTAKTLGTNYTMYAIMKSLSIPLSKEQQEFQELLERKYPKEITKGQK